MPFDFSRDSKSAAFAGAQPRAHPSFGVRARLSTPQSGARKPTIGARRQPKAENGVQTDNRRGSILFFYLLHFSPKRRKSQSAAQVGSCRGSIPTSTKRVSAKSEYVTEDAARISGAMRLPFQLAKWDVKERKEVSVVNRCARRKNLYLPPTMYIAFLPFRHMS